MIDYVEMGAVPGGTNRNWDSYGHKVKLENTNAAHLHKSILADPQTSGGLLIAVAKSSLDDVIAVLQESGLEERTTPIGELLDAGNFAVTVI